MSGYRSIYEWLRWCAKEESWAPGSSLPSESELMTRFTTSRTTVRRAYDLLEREGLAVSVPGRGRFLLGPDGEAGNRREAKYEIIRDSLRAGIASGELPEGELIASPVRLAHLHSCTRQTARRAYAELAAAGLLAHEGRGLWRVAPGAAALAGMRAP